MSFKTLRLLTASALGAVMLLAALVGLTPAFAQESTPQFLVVHNVDATSNPVELTVLTGDYSVTPADVGLIAEGEQVSPTSVGSAIEAGNKVEVVFVVDSNAKLQRADQFAATIEQIATRIEGLPEGVSVGVVSAGSRDQVRVEMTANHANAARIVRGMSTSNGSALFNAMRRGADLFTDDAAHRTMIVTSGFTDEDSVITPVTVRSELVRKNVQVLGARYQGDAGGVIGERQLGSLASVTGGALFDATNSVEFASALDFAVDIGSDRLIVAYDGQTELTERGDLTMTIRDSSISLSYRGGRVTDKPLALQPIIDPVGSPLDILRTKTGLFLTMGLTAAGVLAAVWSLGNIFAGGESTLEGMLRRYSGEEGVELDEEETALVQTALVKKAVEMTESFAEDRGFLARVEETLEQARMPLRAGEAMGIFGMITFVGFFLGFLFTGGSFIRGAILGGITAFVLSWGVQFKARRRVKAFEAQLPDMLQLLAGTLRAGYSLPQGLEAVANEIAEPMGYEMTRAMTEARLGREIEEALEGVAERLDSPDFAWAVMAISIQREVGGNLNELLMTVSDTMVARERLAGEVRALTAEGKLSAAILGGLPPMLGFIMWIMNPAYIESLFTTGMGQILVIAGLISGGIGLAWMKKVITINV